MNGIAKDACLLLFLLPGLLGVCACGPDEVPGGYQPTAESEVLVDLMGVPHIYAATDEDAFFASGYVMARLRLFQIDLVRRQARGTRAAVLGVSALRGDLAARTFRFLELGAMDRARTELEHPADARLFRAFVTGINRYISRVRRGDEPLPAGFGPDGLGYQPELWSEDDPYAIGKMLSFSMSSSLDHELLASVLLSVSPKLGRDLPLSMPVRPAFILPGSDRPLGTGGGGGPGGPQPGPALSPPDPGRLAEALSRYQRLYPEVGSNNWAVSGKATDNGRPLLAGNPHQPLGSPLLFYAQHLNSASGPGPGGPLDVIGFAFAGTPGIQLGHNARVAWTATTNFADVMDLWDVELAPDGTSISLGGVARPAQARAERIRVRGAGLAAGEGDDRPYTITDVPGYGVLLPEDLLPVPLSFVARGQVLFNWTGFAATPEASAYLGFDRAASMDAWEDAARILEVGAANFLGADAASIRYRAHARVPDRGPPAGRQLPWRILDGKDPRTVWSGAVLGADRLPAARDPARGYLVTANNDPWGFTAEGKPEGAPFYYGYFYDPGDRAARIESQLQALVGRGKVGVADFVKLQGDAYSLMADDLLPPLGEAMAALGTNPDLAPYRKRSELFPLLNGLSAWDRQMRRDSGEAVIFFALAHFAARRAMGNELGDLLYTIIQAEPSYAFKFLRLALGNRFPAAGALLHGGRDVVLVGALADTADWLIARFGTLDPGRFAWKDVHGARFDHVLQGRWSAGVYPVDGSVGTVNVSSATMFDGGGKVRDGWTSSAGPIYRMVVGFDADGTPRAVVDFPRGNDEDPQSVHYGDQQAAWLAGTPQPLRFRRADVEAATTARFTVLPEGGTR